jgi:CIC family chloride channel protein
MPDYRVQVLRACGLAAALGGLLQAPIAGFVFAGEIVLGGYAVRSVLPLGISAFSSAYISRQLMGARTAFAVPDFVMASPVEIALYLLVGLASGVTTVVFMGLLQHTGRVHERLNLPSWLRPALGGLVVGAVGLLWPAARGVGYSTLGSLLGGHLVFGAMAALLLAKMAATSMTIGSGGGGGMFAPSMFVGALVGGALGEGTHRIWPQMTGGPHSYAIVGMAAVLAGTTRAPLTAIVLATELTGNYLAVFPVTVAVVVSVFLSSALRDETSQVIRLARRGMNAMARRTGGALHNQRVSDLMRPTHDVVSGDTPMAEVLRCLRVCRDDILIVEDEQQARRVVGVVNLDNVKALMGQGGSVAGKARDMMIPAPLLGERDALAKPLAAFAKCHLPALPVVGEDGRIRGVVTRYDVMDVCARELLQGYLGFSPEGTPVPSDSAVELTPHLHEVSAVPVPRPFTGKTLREIELLRYWGVTCVGLRRATEKGDLAPLPLNTTEPLRAGDVMILIGDKASVDRLRQLDRASERPPV